MAESLVAIIYRSSLEILSIKFETVFSTFECICLKFKTREHKSCITSYVYRPSLLVEDNCISDHFVLTVPLPFSKPKPVANTVNSRNIKSIDMSSFKSSLTDSLNNIKNSITSFSLFNCVKAVLDKFAPIKTRLTTVRPAAPWINIFVKAQKQARRKAERLFKKTGLTVHKEIFKFYKNKTTKVINTEKKKYITKHIAS